MATNFEVWDEVPEDMKIYLRNYGFNFSEKLCEFAVSMMKTKDGKITPMSKSDVDTLLKRYNIELKNDNGYNSVYAANMASADYLGSSVPNEQYLALFIRDYIDDPDYNSTEKPFRHFLADMYGFGKVINWKDML